MNYSNISKKPVHRINQSSGRYQLTLHHNIENLVGKYHSKTPVNCVELKQNFKKGVLK